MSDKEWMTFMGKGYTQPIKMTSDGDRLEIVKGSGFDEWVKDTEPVYAFNRGIVSRHQADREKMHMILDNWLDGKGLSDQMLPEYIR
jgi:hypothetical protein